MERRRGGARPRGLTSRAVSGSRPGPRPAQLRRGGGAARGHPLLPRGQLAVVLRNSFRGPRLRGDPPLGLCAAAPEWASGERATPRCWYRGAGPFRPPPSAAPFRPALFRPPSGTLPPLSGDRRTLPFRPHSSFFPGGHRRRGAGRLSRRKVYSGRCGAQKLDALMSGRPEGVPTFVRLI